MSSPEDQSYITRSDATYEFTKEMTRIRARELTDANAAIEDASTALQALYYRSGREKSLYFEREFPDICRRSILCLIDSATAEFGIARVLVNDKIEDPKRPGERIIRSADYCVSPFVRDIRVGRSQLYQDESHTWVVPAHGFLLRKFVELSSVEVQYGDGFEESLATGGDVHPIVPTAVRALDNARNARELTRMLQSIQPMTQFGGPMQHTFKNLLDS